MVQQLTEEQKAAIDNYADEIASLAGFVEICRLRPGYQLGSLGNKALLSEAREIFQNSIDQIVDKSSPANWFGLYYDERTLEVTCEDNGKGIPLNDLMRVFTKEYTSRNYTRRKGEYPSGLHGVGAKVVNALSSEFLVQSYKYTGEAAEIRFKEGKPVYKEPKTIPNKSKKNGTLVSFIPDTSILGDIDLPWKELFHFVKKIMSLTPIGTIMTFEAIDKSGVKYHENVVNKDGILYNMISKMSNPLVKPIMFGADDGTHKVEVVIDYDLGTNGPSDMENITSFCNFCITRTEGSTHVKGTIDGITAWFTKYMNNIYLINQKAKEKLKITNNDVKCGLNVIINGAHIEPVFENQGKDVIANPDMVDFCKDTVIKGLDDWAKNNPNDLQKVAKFLKDVAENRQKQEAGKAKIVQKYQQNVLTGLPAKYIRPLGKENIELIIVEGDSAKGNVVEGRNAKTQGIFPIRGKISNAFRKSRQEFFSNEEIQGIIKIVFGREWKPGEKFTLEDCKVSKVIFMADADVDGNHICKLLLSIFVVYFPFMIEAGMIYKAIPPLYSVRIQKKEKYFVEQLDIIKYIQKIFVEEHKITFTDGKPLESKDITILFMRNTDYVYYIERMANTFALNPYLLEMILFNYISNGDKIDVSKLQKSVRTAYRFMDVYRMKDGTVEVKGVIDKSNVAIINNAFVTICENLINIMKSNDKFYYIVDGKKLTLYEVCLLYNSSTPNGISRYKGLGEMSTEKLQESVLLPEFRTLIRYTLDDIKETQELMRSYESDPKKILGLIGNVTRDDLID